MLNGLQEDNWYLSFLVNELLELKNSQHSKNARGAIILLFYLGNTLERKREVARFLCNFEMLESPPIKECTSQSVNILNQECFV